MLEQLEKSQFSQGPLREDLMLECFINFLDGNQLFSLIAGQLVLGRDHDPVCALTDCI